jgi:hypothetical protein
MYSGITKIYDRKTVGQVFTKPVQTEGTTQFPPPQKVVCHCSSHFWVGDVSVCSEKMATLGEKSFCVLQYHTSKSVVTVQRAFGAKHAKDPPTDKTIRAWYKQFTESLQQ